MQGNQPPQWQPPQQPQYPQYPQQPSQPQWPAQQPGYPPQSSPQWPAQQSPYPGYPPYQQPPQQPKRPRRWPWIFVAASIGICAAIGNAYNHTTAAQTPLAIATFYKPPTPTQQAQQATKPTQPTKVTQASVPPTQPPAPVPTKPLISQPTQPPALPPTQAPQPTQAPVVHTGIGGNPYGYDFSPGNFIYNPPSDICNYIACIASFWNGRGYVEGCQDQTFSKSGGIQGSCSRHGGNLRPLYSH